MKLGIPTMGEAGLEDVVGSHFGRVPTYTIVDTETNEVEVIKNTSEHMGGTGLPPELMSKAGIQVMLCSALGPRAVRMFEQYGIEVYVGANGTVKDAVELWKAGKLQAATDKNACGQHQH